MAKDKLIMAENNTSQNRKIGANKEVAPGAEKVVDLGAAEEVEAEAEGLEEEGKEKELVMTRIMLGIGAVVKAKEEPGVT